MQDKIKMVARVCSGRSVSRVALIGCAGLGALLLAGCSRFHAKPSDKYVYVTAKQSFLRDRVAAVSNRTGTVTNGEKLVVLERARRFVKVRTPDGQEGWLEEKLTADQGIADEFETLKAKHKDDPVVATAAARDEVYMHLAPGRDTERFFRLAEGDSLSLLSRATVVKPGPPGSAPAAKIGAAKKGPVKGTKAAGSGEATAKAAVKPAKAAEDGEPVEPEPIPMEDWWLVRDAKGDTGWIYSRMIDVSAPDALARYAEGQRFVGAYVLAYADDTESGMVNNGVPVTRIPEYVTVLSPYKAGLPYDFDQVRVFTWNVKKHRYETAFREHNIAGYLPIKLGNQTNPYSKAATAGMALPGFTYRVLAGDAPIPAPDASTGVLAPAKTVEKTYRLEGNICVRILAPGGAPAEAHPVPVKEKNGKGKKGKKR